MALMGTLQDPFSSASRNATLWAQFTGGSATFTYGSTGVQVNYPASTTATTDGDLSSQTNYDLTGSQAYLQVLQVANTGSPTNVDNYLQLGTTTNGLRMLWEGGTLYAQRFVAGAQTNVANVAYNSSTQAYWQIRESGGTTFWEYSATGLAGSWTALASQANPITVTSLGVVIAGTAFGAAASPGIFKWNNFNTIPSGQSFFFL